MYNMDYEGVYRPLKATKRNVEETIAYDLGADVFSLNFIKLEEEPSIWKHSCVATGVTLLNVQKFTFDDGSLVSYAVCPQCGKVIYHVEGYMGGF